jgi:hypothetical protein
MDTLGLRRRFIRSIRNRKIRRQADSRHDACQINGKRQLEKTSPFSADGNRQQQRQHRGYGPEYKLHSFFPIFSSFFIWELS